MPFDHIGGGQLHQALVAEALTTRFDVDLIHHTPGLHLDDLTRHYGISRSGMRLREVARIPARWPYVEAGGPGIRSSFAAHAALTRDYDLFVNVVMGPPIRSSARHSALIVLFPSESRHNLWPWVEPPGTTPLIKRIVRNQWYAHRWRATFGSYQTCIANSDFTAGWVKTRWGLDAETLHPLVQAGFTARAKEKLILSVGRFSRYGTQKKQLEMVRAFVALRSGPLAGWEYVCMGGLANDPVDRRFYEEVCDAAKGHPIRVVANPDGQEVKAAYERASVFWHAAGLGEDESAHPERSEHFGMSTVEAMAAGCVPVVIRRGGQPEIVEQGASGFLWDTLEQLAEYSSRLASQPELRETMARAARLRSTRFTDPALFGDRLLAIVDSGGRPIP
jgi:glycosyltransferase involved in cell wall biosynthesis